MVGAADRGSSAFKEAVMNETIGTNTGTPEGGLPALHRQWALCATRRLRLQHPDLSLSIYGLGTTFLLHVENCDPADFPALVEHFDNSVRPMTCNITLSQNVPQFWAPIEEVDDYEAELWLAGEAQPVPRLNRLLALAEPSLPIGGIDFNRDLNAWVFRTFGSLSDDENACVQRAATKVGLVGPVQLIEESPPTIPHPAGVSTFKLQGDLSVATNRDVRGGPQTLIALVDQDEDEWRQFLSRRAEKTIVAPDEAGASAFACLYDVEHCGDSRLSELLTIYDRVDILPQRHHLDWSSKHQVPLPDLQELVRLKRVRIILPYSAMDYPLALLEAVAEVDRSAIVLSRALATKTIARGQMKEPLLYAPLSACQRTALLSAMFRAVTDQKHRGLLGTYGQMFSGQHDSFMTRGAMASLGFGVGAYLGDAFLKLGNKDARMELGACGAGIEWALGLGASYIPRDFGGYDESWNSQIIASYLSRTPLRQAARVDPVANRMHVISDGLLAVSGVSPLEVARNFHSLPTSRFRQIARKLMHATSSEPELQEAVSQINSEVRAFERRADFLARWKVGTVITHTAAAAFDHATGFIASLAAAWLYEMLEHKIPEKVRTELGDANAMLTGLITGSSIDVVVVSRSRKAITNKHGQGR
jgi:hypothetical protein